jgi:hypothetical protein
MTRQWALRAVLAAAFGFFRLAGPVIAALCSLPTPAVGVTLQKAFNPTTIFQGGTTELVFTVTNAAGSPSRSDLGIVDTLPSGLRVANAPVVGGTCANAAAATIASAGGGTISIFNLQVPGEPGFDVACTVSVRITNAAGQFNSGCESKPVAFTNGASNVSVTNLTNAVSPSCLIVFERIFADGFD